MVTPMSNTENIEPTVETTEVPEEAVLDPDAKTMTMREMSYLLTSQTFAIIGAIGQGLKSRYDQMMTGIPPKAKKSEFNKGYIQALNDVAKGLMQYQDEITERGIADGTLTRGDVPDLPEPEATATDADEKGV
jgi:hypothetical protein